jgi:hypothetical protein
LFYDKPDGKKRLSVNAIRRAVIGELGKHYKWYNRSQLWLGIFWFIGTVLVILLSALTTLAIALGYAGQYKIAIAVISAVATVISTLLATFATRDLWQLRESARIAVSNLLARACLISETDRNAALREAVKLLNEAHKLEDAQSKGFFASVMQKQKDKRSRGK